MATYDARAPKLNVKVERGDQWSIPFALFTRASPTDPRVPLDLTGYTSYLAQIRDAADVVISTLDVDDTNAATGIVVVSLAASITRTFVPDLYFWDFEGTHPVTGPKTFVRGSWSVTADVSRT